MRSCCRSVCFLLLMDSNIPPRVGRAWRPIRRVVHFGPRCINRLVSYPLGWAAQGDQAKGSLLGLGVKGVTVSPHATLNSSNGVITCGELLNVPTEEILKELQGQGVSHVRRISIRRDGQLLNTKHLILTFDSAKLPENIKAGYMRLSVRTYIPNPLRYFKCQRFGHSKTSCRGTLTCARCAEIGHEVPFAPAQRKARKRVNSQTPTPGNSYVSVAKKSFSAPSVQHNPDASAVACSKPSDSTAEASPSITNLPVPCSPSVAPVSAEALASPDFNDFQLVRNKKKLKKDSPTKTNNSITKEEKIAKFYTTSHREITNPIPTKDNISTHQSALKPFPTTKPTSVGIELLPMAAPQGHIFFRCDGHHDPEVP
ncbi:hypothetical protein AVEN_95106-1 [Araneus ventricosus]|uniref:CCHC-type domain-containing protein n=1 Tax=Araneus ventricosus TaxID=182803 RepID=A0A4Y2WHZ2_ARAVE|nr:hypothetical protein AVEN_95106-1 [Araneus ventricosus]